MSQFIQIAKADSWKGGEITISRPNCPSCSVCAESGTPVFLNWELIASLLKVVKMCACEWVVCMNRCYLPTCEREGWGQEGEVSPEVYPSPGTSEPQHIRGSDLLAGHLMTGNLWCKATRF